MTLGKGSYSQAMQWHGSNWENRGLSLNARVAELVDAPDLGSGVRKDVWVRVPSWSHTGLLFVS